jgi:sugar/nucleoside kinase (ribokinase family)
VETPRRDGSGSSSFVVCVGLATLDTIAAVPRHPGAEDRVVATAHAVAGGGPAATAAVTLARLGVPVYFVGAVGDDRPGEEIRAGLEAEGVDVSELTATPDARSPQSSILVGEGTRTIVAYPGTARLDPSGRVRALCRDAAWTHVDHAGYGHVPPGVRLSIDGGNPIQALDLRGVDLYAPTAAALRERLGTPQAALDAGAKLVVVTRGADGSTAYTPDGGVVDAPAHAADVVSTLGAGDVFHGALLAHLVRGAPLEEALPAANLAAALACRALDGRSAIPTAKELRECLTTSR